MWQIVLKCLLLSATICEHVLDLGNLANRVLNLRKSSNTVTPVSSMNIDKSLNLSESQFPHL